MGNLAEYRAREEKLEALIEGYRDEDQLPEPLQAHLAWLKEELEATRIERRKAEAEELQRMT